MMRPISKPALLVLAVLSGSASPALAQQFDPNFDEMSHSDQISISAGNANRANIAIQTPTPWPKYLNDFDFDMPGQQGVDLMTRYKSQFAAPAAASSTTININQAK